VISLHSQLPWAQRLFLIIVLFLIIDLTLILLLLYNGCLLCFPYGCAPLV
jgi:hypothetical protein